MIFALYRAADLVDLEFGSVARGLVGPFGDCGTGALRGADHGNAAGAKALKSGQALFFDGAQSHVIIRPVGDLPSGVGDVTHVSSSMLNGGSIAQNALFLQDFAREVQTGPATG